jgi:hypothetical protein
MLYLTALLILVGLAAACIPVWPRMPRADRLLVVLVLAYVTAALFLPPPQWLSRWLPSAGAWFYVGVSVGLAGFGLFRVFVVTPPPAHRGLLLVAVLVAALPAMSVALFALVWR